MTSLCIVIHHNFFLLYKSKFSNTINTQHFDCLQQNPYQLQNYSIDRSTIRQSIARNRTVDRWPYFHQFNISRDSNVTMSKHHPDSRTILRTYNESEYENFEENKGVSQNGLQTGFSDNSAQFCLTLEEICCSRPAASGNRSVLGSNKITVVLEPSQLLYIVARWPNI